MILEVLKYPDPRLRRKAMPVESVTEELRALAQDMLETMYAERGIGLASIQVGVEKQLLVIDIRPMAEGDRYDLSNMTELEKQVTMPLVIFNPKITKKEGKTTYEEGCLSLPGYYETVQRFDTIEVEGLDLDNQLMSLKLDGLLAICMQHEMDHLDGKVFLDRLSPIKSARLKSKIKKFGYPKKDEDNQDEDSSVTNEI
ncbi:MAG: peptide deformylase [Bdellovibrionaceae bacterium]|nr:peptide deformylase [Pseudobdellovibrionaceae bacterium]